MEKKIKIKNWWKKYKLEGGTKLLILSLGFIIFLIVILIGIRTSLKFTAIVLIIFDFYFWYEVVRGLKGKKIGFGASGYTLKDNRILYTIGVIFFIFMAVLFLTLILQAILSLY